MKSPFAKIAAAAVFITSVFLTIIVTNKSTTSAYALDDTIKASRNIRYCHFQRRDDVNWVSSPQREVWIEYAENNEVNNSRVNFNDVNCVVVWKKDMTQYWRKDDKSVQIFQDELYTPQILNFTKRYDPKNAIENIKNLKNKDEVQILIKEPTEKNELIIVEVEYPENTFLISRSFPRAREIFSIDQNTKLIRRIDLNIFTDGEFKSAGYYEYLDYDIPFNPELFEIEKEVPSDVEWVNMKTLDVGIERGELSEEDIAIKASREFIEALIAKDYAKALKICNQNDRRHRSDEEAELLERFKKINIVEIVSIDKLVLSDSWSSGRAFSCKVKEVDNNGNETIRTHAISVDRSIGTNRWVIKNFN